MDEEARLGQPNRAQLILQTVDYETGIGEDHPARAIRRVLAAMEPVGHQQCKTRTATGDSLPRSVSVRDSALGNCSATAA